MSSPKDDGEDTGITLHTRSLNRIEVGKPVVLDYRSNRGKKGRKQKSGEIISVQALGNGWYRFQFYDADSERKIEVTLQDTIENSRVKSKKTETWSVIGDTVQVLVSDTAETEEDVEQEFVLGKRNNDFDVVVAAAEISDHKNVIKWFAKSGCL